MSNSQQWAYTHESTIPVLAYFAMAKAPPHKKPSGSRQPAFVLHRQSTDGSESVYLGNLRVLITKHEDGWLAQGLEADYAIDGATLDEVKQRFEQGLGLTVQSHLRVYKHAKNVLTVAPQTVWDKFFAVVPPDVQHKSNLITVHVVPKRSIACFPLIASSTRRSPESVESTMGDAALREDVIVALEGQPGVTVTRLPDGVIEVIAPGQPLRTFPLKVTVSRGLLSVFERYYGVSIAAHYPHPSTKRDKDKNVG